MLQLYVKYIYIGLYLHLLNERNKCIIPVRRSSHKMENERGAGKGSKLWDQLPLTLKQEDIAN